MSIFEEAKERLDIMEVAQRYGIEVNRYGKALCPFHAEDTPSFSLSGERQRFHCFGCDASGDVIELAARLLNLTAIEAVRRLNSDFGLGLSLDKPPDRKEMQGRQRDNRIYAGFQRWEKRAFRDLCGLFHRLREDMATGRPAAPDAPLPLRFALTLQNMERVEYLLDVLMYGSFGDKIQLYKSEEVGKVVKRCQAKNQNKLSS